MRMFHQSKDNQTIKSAINTFDGTIYHSSNSARDHQCAAHLMRIAMLDCMERCNHTDLDTGWHGIIEEVDVQSQYCTTPEIFMDACPVECCSMDGNLIYYVTTFHRMKDMDHHLL